MSDFEKERYEKKRFESFERFLVENLERIKEEKESTLNNALEALKEGDEDARWMAVGVLGETGDERIIIPLIETISADRSPRVRAEAVNMLGDYKDMERPFDSLIEAMKDPSEVVRQKVFEILDGVTVRKTTKGRYESSDGRNRLLVERPDNQLTRFTFFSRKDKKMQRLKQKTFILSGPSDYIRGETDKQGCAVFGNKALRDIGYGFDDDRIRFVLR